LGCPPKRGSTPGFSPKRKTLKKQKRKNGRAVCTHGPQNGGPPGETEKDRAPPGAGAGEPDPGPQRKKMTMLRRGKPGGRKKKRKPFGAPARNPTREEAPRLNERKDLDKKRLVRNRVVLSKKKFSYKKKHPANERGGLGERFEKPPERARPARKYTCAPPV